MGIRFVLVLMFSAGLLAQGPRADLVNQLMERVKVVYGEAAPVSISFIRPGSPSLGPFGRPELVL
jgi:hypothetical protein